MGRAAYAYRRCRHCGRSISVAGLAQYNHLAAHYRRVFRGKRPLPRTTQEIEQSLRGRMVPI